MPLQAGGGLPPPLEVTCKFREPDVALPGFGFVTATAKVPAEAALTEAVSCVDETNVVESGEPAKSTCAPFTNPLPFNVIVNAPVVTDEGETLVRAGTGFSNVTVALPFAVVEAALTAVTVAEPEAGTELGAV